MFTDHKTSAADRVARGFGYLFGACAILSGLLCVACGVMGDAAGLFICLGMFALFGVFAVVFLEA